MREQRKGLHEGSRTRDPHQDGHDIVVIGASTGGVEALMHLVHGLPEDLPAAVCVVMHFPPEERSVLPRILSRYGPLPASHAMDGEPIVRGRIYVAPPDRHLLVEWGRLRVVRGPKENRMRPAVDPLFRSAALAYGVRVVGVVLTGALDDGTAGLLAIKRLGGVAVVQDPKDALVPGMPESALEYVSVDHSVPLSQMPALLARLAHAPSANEPDYPTPELLRYETNMAELDEGTMERAETPGTLSSFSCPECGGPIYELRDGKLVRFRCRSGHAFTYESMAAEQAQSVEEALWVAVNTLMESFQLSKKLARAARERGHVHTAHRFEERMADMRRRAELLRGLLHTDDGKVPTEHRGESGDSGDSGEGAEPLDEASATAAGA